MGKKLLLLTFTILTIFGANAQCQIFAETDQNNIDCGDSITVTLNGFSDVLLSEGFCPNGPCDPNWVYTSSAMYSEPYIPSPTMMIIFGWDQ